MNICCVNNIFWFDFPQNPPKWLCDANICVTSTAIQLSSPQTNAAQSSVILRGIHVNIEYRKIKDRGAARGTIQQCASHFIFLSLPILVKEHERTLLQRIHMFVIHQIEYYHT